MCTNVYFVFEKIILSDIYFLCFAVQSDSASPDVLENISEYFFSVNQSSIYSLTNILQECGWDLKRFLYFPNVGHIL